MLNLDRNACVLIDQLANDIHGFVTANPDSQVSDFMKSKFAGVESPKVKAVITNVRDLLVDNGNLVKSDHGVGRVKVAVPGVPPFNLSAYLNTNAGAFVADKLQKQIDAKKKEIGKLEAERRAKLGGEQTAEPAPDPLQASIAA